MIKNDVPPRGFLSLSYTASQVYMFHPELLPKKLSPELYNVCKTVENEIDIFDTPQINGDELHYNQKYTSDRIAMISNGKQNAFGQFRCQSRRASTM